MFSEKVYIGLEHAPPAFDLRARILGPNGNNVDYIKSETGASVYLKSEKAEPMHLLLLHARTEQLASARSLALNLIETVKQELSQWMAQTVPPPAVPASSAGDTEQSITPSIIPTPAVSMANSPVVSMRPQTVLQIMPQQQYILNQDGSQLIPLIQQGSQGNYTQLTTLPIAQNAFNQQTSMGNTQFVDANMQPVSVAQYRFAQNSMPYLQNGVAISQVSLANQDTTTVSYSSLLPVSSTISVPAASTPSIHATQTAPSTSQKMQWAEKGETKQEVKYHYQLQSGEQVQFMPANSQTMYIPYQQLQDLTSGQQGSGIQHQIVSISPGGLNAWPGANTALPLQFQSLQQTGSTLNHNMLQLNQKPSGNTSLINLWSAQPGQTAIPAQLAPNQQIIGPNGQVWSAQQLQNAVAASQGTGTFTPVATNNHWMRPSLPQGSELIPLNPLTSNKGATSQDTRAQKRMSDGTPSQLQQLRPIAPAGSQLSQVDKVSGAKETRLPMWTATAGRESAGTAGNQITMSVKGSTSQINIAPATSTVQTGTSTVAIAPSQDNLSTRHTDKIISFTSKDNSQQSGLTKSIDSKGQNYIQMYTVSPNMHNITQLPPSLGQTNQMYIMPTSQGTLPQNMVAQTLPIGQGNISMIQPNQLSLQQGMQYNTVPLMHLNVPPNVQYLSQGLNLNNPASAQQLNLAMANQQIMNPNMLQNMQANPAQTQHYQGSVQALNSQPVPNSIQYNMAGLHNAQTQQYVVPTTQQQAVTVPTTQYSATQAQFPSQQQSYVLPAQQNSQQYTQLNTANPLSQGSQQNDNRNPNNASSQNSYIPPNISNPMPVTNPQNIFTQNTQNSQTPSPQAFTPGSSTNAQTAPAPASSQTNQTYPNVNSPSVQQSAYSTDPVNPQQANQTAANPQGSFPQANSSSVANNTFANGAQMQYNGNQYRPWGVRPRYPTPPGGNYGVPPPVAQQAPPQGPSAPGNNYWQYS